MEAKGHEQLDSSVILEVLSNEKIKGKKLRIMHNRCKSYIRNLKNNQAKISISALGEIVLTLIYDPLYGGRKEFSFDDLIRLVSTLDIGIVNADKVTLQRAIEIMETDARITPQDAQRVAEAIASGAKRLVTLDKQLVADRILQDRFSIRIEYPWGAISPN